MTGNGENVSECWCLVGNIVDRHEFGELHELHYGTKQFRPGAKVYIAPIQWGDGGEKVVVIGVPRHTKQFIEIVTRREYIANFRIKRIYSPTLLKIMRDSEFLWWDNTQQSHDDIVACIEALRNPHCESD